MGAKRELQELYAFLHTSINGEVGDALQERGIEGSFIPPYSPHLEGLWEAGVKSCKYHLRRIMGNALFTFKELTTSLVQIEACLNSRPLSPLSSDLEPLTPGHFLIEEPLTSLPDNDLADIKTALIGGRWFNARSKNFGTVSGRIRVQFAKSYQVENSPGKFPSPRPRAIKGE